MIDTRVTCLGGRRVSYLRCADNIILLASSEAKLHELLTRLDMGQPKYGLLIHVDKTKLTDSDGAYCRTCLHCEKLEQVDTTYQRRYRVHKGDQSKVGQRSCVTKECLERSRLSVGLKVKSNRNVSVRPSVRLSVCPSVTRWYCVKTKKASVIVSSPSGSPKTLVF